MIKNLREYLSKIFNKLYLINNSIKIKKEVLHTIFKNDLSAELKANEQEILFGCGCFWGAEKGFWRLPGIISTAVGYAGGDKENPTYREVCTGLSGHTEVVRVVWNNNEIDISDLLKLFWECHDPTQGNRQGNDIGSQYRSAIYTTNKNQLNKVIESKKSYQKELQNNGFGEITTEITNDVKFYFAEEYHQQYLAKPGSRPYCSAMPTKVIFKNFKGANFKLNEKIWSYYNWDISHCILRGENTPIKSN
ncbi:peptide-methionine (S)-S-oxide reductase MsrA [Prochlorococcus marinus]|uniref:Peptide methionine sulfoxide reductase MsrA n=1 Tax=Prochlorococcus marinus XMU1408 TaxID=2213228 RepID=A0A318R4B3_PROMR|nr:peptide-methionine (S)-S-oxide reductase MsrA [Prochlorococcus marinus]MBW3041883.1 peptide-methionine (S)-S-oxide reductase MsrA [Prochlorococcus marinus str. XMU1408]PYE03014.1 peptide-methionine (S)-S-oxide reductase MsrA [Prochlorococcus marinus XMU1408]